MIRKRKNSKLYKRLLTGAYDGVDSPVCGSGDVGPAKSVILPALL